MKKLFITLLLLLLAPVKASAFDTVCLQVEKNRIIVKELDLKSIKRLDFDKTPTFVYKIKQRDGFDVVILENTEIPLDELFTKKGIIKLLPAVINVYISMNTLKLYSGQEDKVLHHTLNYVVTRLTNKPFTTAISFSIGKELCYDMLLGNPDWMDTKANLLGALHGIMTKNNINNNKIDFSLPENSEKPKSLSNN